MRHFICLYVLYPYKKNSRIFPPILLRHGPWCPLRLSIQWNQTGGMGADSSATSLDLWVVPQIWGWLLHSCLTCLWGAQFSQLLVISDFKFSSGAMLHHHSQKLDYDSGAWSNRKPTFASLLSIVHVLESICRDIHVYHYGSMERYQKEDGQIFKISNGLLLVYRNTMDFSILTLYPATLINSSFISSRRVFFW